MEYKDHYDYQQPLNLESGMPPTVAPNNVKSSVTVSKQALIGGASLLAGASLAAGVAIGSINNQIQLIDARNQADIAKGQITELDSEVVKLCREAEQMRKRRK